MRVIRGSADFRVFYFSTRLVELSSSHKNDVYNKEGNPQRNHVNIIAYLLVLVYYYSVHVEGTVSEVML